MEKIIQQSLFGPEMDIVLNSDKTDKIIKKLKKTPKNIGELSLNKLLKSNICSEFSTKLEQKQDVDELHTILRFGYRRKWLPLFNHVQLYNLTLIREAYKAINELV